MTVSREELRALADREIVGEEARALEAAIAADPELAAQLAAERKLRAALAGHFALGEQAPVPQAWQAMIAAAAAEADDQAATTPPDNLVDLAGVRQRRQSRRMLPAWGMGAAIAASLLIGVMIAPRLAQQGNFAERSGAVFASGSLAGELESRLASAGPDADGGRILATFQQSSGGYCRVFSARAAAGIACREAEGRWRVERFQAGGGDAGSGAYRQAGTANADLLAAAQEMSSGEPLGAAAEAAVVGRRWK